MPRKRPVKAKAEFHPKYKVPRRLYDIEEKASTGNPRKIAEDFLARVAGELQINPDLSELKFDQIRESMLGKRVLFQQQRGGLAISPLDAGHEMRERGIRGLAEITRLAVKKGANPLTLSGLAGLGDLVLTCSSELSRNRTVGFGIGQGKGLEQVQKELGQVAEGVRNARSVNDLAQRLGVEMPISHTVYRMLYQGVPAQVAVRDLLGRETKAELQG